LCTIFIYFQVQAVRVGRQTARLLCTVKAQELLDVFEEDKDVLNKIYDNDNVTEGSGNGK